MKINFCCIICGSPLSNNSESYSCSRCDNPNVAKKEDGYVDFINDVNDKSEEKTLKEIVKLIDKVGYNKGIELILTKYPDIKHEFSKERVYQSGDSLFHCFSKNNHKCLEIGSNLGNISEELSYFFQEVYSIDSNREKIEFQKRRFSFKKRDNVFLVRSYGNKIPFPDNHFDLIMLNGLEQIDNFYPKNVSKKSPNEFLKELRRKLNDDGCLLLGVYNKGGINFVTDKIMKFKTKTLQKQNLKKYSHTFNDYQNLLHEIGFSLKSYWVLPSFDIPYYSGKIDDEKSARWFLENINNFLPSFKKKSIKQKLLFFGLKNLSSKLIKSFMKLSSPSFLFCCYKNNMTENLDEIVVRKTGFDSYLTISRRFKIMYILFGKDGLPKKVASFRKYFNMKKEEAPYPQVPKFNAQNLEDQILVEDWKEGRLLDPFNMKEVIKAIQWIVDFQKNHEQEPYSIEEISYEIKQLKEGILKNPNINYQFSDWIKDYEDLMTKNKIKKSAVHGDLSFRNIIINPKNRDLNVIDWHFFKETGNPFDDISMFLFRLLVRSNKLNETESFRTKVLGLDRQFNELRKKIEKKFSDHFGFKFDLILIMKIYILKSIIKKIQKGKNIQNELKYAMILSDCNGLGNI